MMNILYLYNKDSHNKAGFTLVELSIIIVIIGLIAVGIVGGKSLVKQAKLRNVISDVSDIKQSIRAFKLEYDKLPGDIINASSYWSGVGNGNQNNIIDSSEGAIFWVHLSRANLYPGTFSGVGTEPPVPDVNAPSGPFKGTWYRIHRHNGADTVYGRLKTTINFNGSNHSWGGAISGKDAYAIDLKIDDGIAHSGIISTAKAYLLSGQNDVCTQGINNYRSLTPVLYNPNDEVVNCWMFFWLEGVVY